jgi:hypothetical protein
MAVRRKPDPLEYELQQERAAALGRAGGRVEQTIAAPEASEAAGNGAPDEMIESAASAVWNYMIVRDALGFHDHAQVLALYRVPPWVLARVGVVRRTPS